jgi:hypothetical protein
MPFVDEFDPTIPMFVVSGGADFSADGSVSSFFIVHINAGVAMSLNGSIVRAGSVSIEGAGDPDFVGRVNDDANVFGGLTIAGAGSFSAIPTTTIRGKLIIQAAGALSVHGRVASGDSSACRISLTIADPIDNGSAASYSARLTADGIEYKIRGYEFNEGRQSYGVSLNVTLQKPTQRDAVLAASAFKFELYTGAAWETVFDTGVLAGAGFSIAWNEGRPANQLSISTTAPILDALTTSPPLNLTIYDSNRENINAADFENILDESGHIYSHDLVPIPGMTLFQLLRYIFVIRLGMAAPICDIPDIPIRRSDVGMSDNYLAGISGHIGNFEPLIYEKDGILNIKDTTVRLPAGVTPSIVLDHTKYLNAQFRETKQDADGFLVSYVQTDTDYDYSSTRDVPFPTSSAGDPGAADYTETDIVQIWTDFYKYSNPAAPVRSEKSRETTTLSGMVRSASGILTLQTISETTENIFFDSKMRLQTITKEIVALIPNVTGGVPFDFVTDFVHSERTTFEYKADIFDPKREYVSKMEKKITALVATETDPANDNVGDKFKQEFFDCWRAGNFTDTMTIALEPVKLVTETAQQTKKGQTEIRQRTTHYLTNPPAVTGTTTDGRTGDNTENASSGSTAEMIVYRDGLTARAGRKLVQISVNEIPPRFFIPLLKRKLAFRNRRDGTVTLKGMALALVRGSSFRLLDQDDVSAGDFLVEGRSITGTNLGTREQQTRQVLEVIQI